ncbi:hypothetical protein K2173_006723 [Erythroxylum novogranatense]|uniref:Uncharacterized protein n=1 Tax=Erythroxylum novogranatense TaxID=1862640 RepID=A0AAV8TE00_9ROSI|nr:hypothetical protein K2173_006723 [Erythroxylum novogranatense]
MIKNARNETAAELGRRVGNQSLKKGPWTAAEDDVLMEYVRKHGEGNWNSVQKYYGLLRCGKSCRLRWANHLRPNLKKGSFTPEEERTIMELHAKLGNKWARMASQLPGRTDNEIKNFWNTRIKKRQRAGLPIYSHEFSKEALAAQFHQDQQKFPDSSPPSLSSIWNSTHHKPVYNASEMTAMDPLQNHHSYPFYSSPIHHQFKFDGDCSTASNRALTFSLPAYVSPYPQSPTSTTPFYQNLAAQVIPTPPSQSLHHNTLDFENSNMSITSVIVGAQVEPIGFLPGLKSGFFSPQTSAELLHPILSQSTRDFCLVEESSEKVDHDRKRARQGDTNSDLLGTGKYSLVNSLMPSKRTSDKEAMEEMNSFDDDQFKPAELLQSSMPLPGWCRKSENESNGPSLGSFGEVRGLDADQDDASMNQITTRASMNQITTTDQSLDWAFGLATEKTCLEFNKSDFLKDFNVS